MGARLGDAEALKLAPHVAVRHDELGVHARQRVPLRALLEVVTLHVLRRHELRPAHAAVVAVGHARHVRLRHELRPQQRRVVQRDACLRHQQEHAVTALLQRRLQQLLVRRDQARLRKLRLDATQRRPLSPLLICGPCAAKAVNNATSHH